MKHYKLIASLVLVFGYYVGSAQAHTRVIEFSDSRIIIEVNATDDDSGIQMFVDGEGWDWLIVFDPKWRTVLRVRGSGSVGEIVGYQVIVEQEDPLLRVFSADVPPDVTSIVIPASFMVPGVEYKFEVLAIEESGNQTLSERAFSTAPMP